MTEPESAEHEASFGDNLVEQMFSLWVDDELASRGGKLAREDLYRVVVELPPSGGTPIVRLNDEVSLQVKAVAATSIKKGDPVTVENIKSIEYFWPVDVHADSGWLAYIVIGESQYVAFDFRYNKQRAGKLLSLADDYLEAVEAVTDKALRPAVDNLLSAAELTVQAQMLSQAHETKFHNVRDKWLHEFERLGNTPTGFFDLLKRLRNERAAARYGDGDGELSITIDEMPMLIARVRGRVAHAAELIGVVAASPAETEAPDSPAV